MKDVQSTHNFINIEIMLIVLGPRTCLGEPLAKMELFLVFTNLIQRFTFCREKEGTRHTLKSIIGRITSAPIPFNIRAIPRA